jgi:hypothetical protein
MPVIHLDRRFIRLERNIAVPTNLNPAPFAGNHLVELPAVFTAYGNHLVAQNGFSLPSEVINPFVRNCNRMFHRENSKMARIEGGPALIQPPAGEIVRSERGQGDDSRWRLPKNNESILIYTQGCHHSHPPRILI